MIEPLLSDQAFLDDVDATLKLPGQIHLWWLGQSGYLLRVGGRSIVIDPYLSDSLTVKYAATDKPHTRISRRVVDPAKLGFADVVLSSHAHTDHLDPETLRPLLAGRTPGPFVIAPAAILPLVAERTGRTIGDTSLVGVDAGVSTSFFGMTITAVASAHETVERDEQRRCRFLGFVIDVGGFRIYHSGDTMLYDGLVETLRPFDLDIALLPINGRKPERRVAGNTNGREAAWLAKEIGAGLVIPHHYDLFAFNTADPADEFIPECQRLGQPYRVLRLGERHSADFSASGVEKR
ncbi:MBL fold metallo-hydrolase [Humisphaera borealis]|uniref:MBL fold metallo-hydrolase n=1 Tax=Humisphaera borealis TaxID=2807512 RepID=A0A7M2X1V5_9BACT|nr:MBL fold metallo-hydrolase [Humisphaera borealis]QOV90720.1 MBL fold metallo-hydrolase [Humisphaera borealis]